MSLRDRLPASHPLRRGFRRLQAAYRISRTAARHGRPAAAIYFPAGGIGDDLLATSLVAPLHRATGGSVWALSTHPEIFAGLPGVSAVVPPTEELAARLAADGVRLVRPTYTENLEGGSRHTSPREHILAVMARAAGLDGDFALRPTLALRADETAAAAFARDAIVLQSSGLGARFPIPNKEWLPDRFATVASALAAQHSLIQIGSPSDPLLPGARDLRGQTTPRQLAAIVSVARLFVGLVGFPMHLARAVDCPAVIVYGGREAPWQSGYSANLNVARTPVCAPCWLVDRCDYDRVCMRDIAASEVLEAIATMLARPRGPLVVDTVRLAL